MNINLYLVLGINLKSNGSEDSSVVAIFFIKLGFFYQGLLIQL